MAKKIPFSCVFASGMSVYLSIHSIFIKLSIDEDLPTYPASELNSHGPHIFGKDFFLRYIQSKLFTKQI